MQLDIQYMLLSGLCVHSLKTRQLFFYILSSKSATEHSEMKTC